MGDAFLPLAGGLSQGLSQGMVTGQEQRRKNMLEESLKTKQKMEKLQFEQAQQLMDLTKELPAAWRIAAMKNPELLIYMDILKTAKPKLSDAGTFTGGDRKIVPGSAQGGGLGAQNIGLRMALNKLTGIDIIGEQRKEAQASGWRTQYDPNTGGYFDVQYNKVGGEIQRKPAPTPTQKITGVAGPGGRPQTVLTSKDMPPGAKRMPTLGAFPEVVKPTAIVTKGAGGEKTSILVDPFSNELIGGEGKGIEIEPKEIDMNVPLTVQELLRFRDPVTGAPPKYGMTRRAAIDAGFLPVTTIAETQRMAEMASDVILGQLETTAKKIFTARGPLDRLLQIPKALWALYLQTNTDVVLYESLKNGVLANIVRTLGEKGTLAEGDIERARELFPTYAPVPDTKEVAEWKLRQLRDLMAEFEARRKGEKTQKPTHKYVPGKGLVEIQ